MPTRDGTMSRPAAAWRDNGGRVPLASLVLSFRERGFQQQGVNMKVYAIFAALTCSIAVASEEHTYQWTWPVRAGAYDLGTISETSTVATDFDRETGNFAVRSAKYSADIAVQLPRSRSYTQTEQVWVPGTFPDPGHWETIEHLHSIQYVWSSSPPEDFVIDYLPVANVQQKFIKSLPQGGWESASPVLFRQTGTPSELDFSFIEQLRIDGKLVSAETFDLRATPASRYRVAPIRVGWQYVSDDLSYMHNTVGPGLYSSDQWAGLPLRGNLDQLNILCTYTTPLGRMGDLTINGSIDFADFVVLADNFGLRGGWENGDLDCNGFVQFGDFAILAENFGRSATRPVPEPGMYALTLALAVLWLRHRS